MSDLIDRQAAIELILSGKVDDDSPEWVGVECPEECNSFLEWAAEEVGKMPSAERKKGRWEVAIGYDQNKKVMCTECRLMSYEPTPFCPNCGADMRGEEG